MQDFKSVGVVKTGFLIKRARDSGRNWKKRYFVLNDNTLTYYESDKNLTKPKGDLLLVDDTVVSDEDLPNLKYTFKVATPFETILLQAESEEDKLSWKVSFMRALDLVQHSLRGYMFRKATSLLEKNIRKFFVYHEKTLYMHKDHEHTTSCQFVLRVTGQSKCTIDQKLREITLSEDQQSITMVFEDRNQHEMMIWYEAFSNQIKKFSTESKEAEVKKSIENCTMKGIIGVRSPQGEAWKSMYGALVNNEIVMMSLDSQGNPLSVIDTFSIEKSSKFSQTTLRSHSFEIVSSNRILHVCTKTDAQLQEWLASLRPMIQEKTRTKQGKKTTGQKASQITATNGTTSMTESMNGSMVGGSSMMADATMSMTSMSISEDGLGYDGSGMAMSSMVQSSSESTDMNMIGGSSKSANRSSMLDEDDGEEILYRDAVALIPKDTFYEITFKENKAIGIVLERAGDWAITKIADFKETGVRVGSALTFVNGETVIFDEYQKTIERFKGWKPPLKLIFRVAPAMFGYLKKKPGTSSGKWKKYYYMLNDGKLCYRNTDDPKEKNIGELSLVGANVSLVNDKEAGKKYCFKILTPAQCLVLHARNTKHMREWAAMLYHAVGIANGGRHIIEYERQRLLEQEAREYALQMQQVEEENSYIVDLISQAIQAESITDLQSALDLAESVGLCGEFIEYSKEYMAKLENIFRMNEANLASMETVRSEVVTEVVEEYEQNEDGTIDESKRVSRKVVQEPEPEDFDQEDEGYDEVEEEQEIVVEVEQEGSQWGPPASVEDLKSFYIFFVKKTAEGEYINVMQFSTIWRMVTGERGNLFKEMQMFNKFDTQKVGAMNEADFVSGWMNLAITSGSDEYLCRIKYLLGEDNMLL